jgi:hypothetical protein
LTQTDSNKHLNETGNKNILANPSFEHSTFSTSWVNSAGTFSQETSIVIDGKASAKLVLSSETMSLSQSSTLYQAQFADGVQGLVSVRVKSDVALKVCSIQAGVVSTSNCVDVQANNKWGLYKVPMILGATSNGISIASSGSVSGTVYIDDVFVGAVDLQAIADQTRYLGGVSYGAGSSASGWRSYNGTGSLISGSSGFSYNDSTKIITLTESGDYKIDFVTAYAVSTASSGLAVALTINGLTEQCGEVALGGGDTGGRPKSTCNLKNLPANSTIILRQYTSSNLASSEAVVNIFKFGSTSTYSSTNADTDWQACTFSTLAWQGLGTVTNNLECKRQGGDLLIKGRFTSGTVSGVEARMNLPTWNGVQLLSAGIQKIPVIQLAGSPLIFNASNSSFFIPLIEPSVSYIAFGLQASSTNAGLTKVTGSVLTGSSIVQSINARIPIEGWQNSNIIIGQFNGLESCTNTLECTDTFSAKISSTGVVSGENVDWINGSGSVVSNRVSLTFNSGIFTVAPNCVAMGLTVDNNTQGISYDSLTSSGIRISQSRADAYTAAEFTLTCQKQGVDYIGKTARAVSSDQNVSTPGTIKSTICSWTQTSGTVSDQRGGCVASGSVSGTTQSVTFTSNYWVTRPNCFCTAAQNDAFGDRICKTVGFPTTSALTVQTSAGTSSALYPVSVFCHGERQ